MIVAVPMLTARTYASEKIAVHRRGRLTSTVDDDEQPNVHVSEHRGECAETAHAPVRCRLLVAVEARLHALFVSLIESQFALSEL